MRSGDRLTRGSRRAIAAVAALCAGLSAGAAAAQSDASGAAEAIWARFSDVCARGVLDVAAGVRAARREGYDIALFETGDGRLSNGAGGNADGGDLIETMLLGSERFDGFEVAYCSISVYGHEPEHAAALRALRGLAERGLPGLLGPGAAQEIGGVVRNGGESGALRAYARRNPDGGVRAARLTAGLKHVSLGLSRTKLEPEG